MMPLPTGHATRETTGATPRGWRAAAAALLRRLPRAAWPLATCIALNATAASPDCPPPPDPTPEQLREAAAHPRDRGLLWQIDKDGRTSYLYGTLHVGRLPWVFPGPRVSAAIGQAQVLALELDVGDPGVARALAADMGRHDAAPPPVDPKRLQRLAAQMRAACIDATALGEAPPLLQVITLSVAHARREGLEPAYAQEFALGALFRALGKPVRSLETPQLQLQALLAMPPAEAVRSVDQALDALENGRSASVLKRLAQAWEAGQLQELAQYEQWCECIETEADRLWLRRLNDDRNPALAEGIDTMHRQGQRVFAAVGALHMTGPRGLPMLMQQRGYAVRRIDFDARQPM
jgi:uncharacterized protein YbaP (TraB family)